MSTIPDLVLAGGYIRPAQDAINFTVYLVGEDPGGPALPGSGLYASVAVPYRSSKRRGPRRLDSRWHRAPAQDDVATAAWRSSRAHENVFGAPWGRASINDALSGGDWGMPSTLQVPRSAAWGPVYPRDCGTTTDWQAATPLPAIALVSGWTRVFATDDRLSVAWRKAAKPSTTVDPFASVVSVAPSYLQRVPRGNTLLFALTPGPVGVLNFSLQRRVLYGPARLDALHFVLRSAGGTDFVLTGADPYQPELIAVLHSGYMPGPLDVSLGTVPPAALVSGSATTPFQTDPSPAKLPWGRSATADLRETVVWGRGPQLGPRDPPPIDVPSGSTHEPPPTPIPRQVYILMNDVQVVLLPERTPIQVESVDLDTSVDTWCWSARMELADPAQLALLKPTAAGIKVVEITLNGYVWTIGIEGRDGTRAHPIEGGRATTVTGRSQTALLTDNYTARRSQSPAEARSAQQLALEEITDRQLPFTIDWDGLDWIVPGGAWSYQDLAPIDVVSQIAAARGAVVQSSPNEAKLLVRSRYPTSPWTWSPDTADIALLSDWVVSESAQQQNKPLYDAVFVSGQQQGVSARVTRQGEAGETWATQVVDSLIVTADVAAERGRVILSDRGMQDLIQVDIPLFSPGTNTASATGLYTPLMLVDVNDPTDPYQALSVAVSISARRGGEDGRALEIWQTVTLERHLSDAN